MIGSRQIWDDPEHLTEYKLESPQSCKLRNFRYIVLPGNFPDHIRQQIRNRGNWQELEDEDEAIESAHFVWRPVNYTRQGYSKINARKEFNEYPLVFNHFEHIKWISTKTGLIDTLKEYYENNPEAAKIGYEVFDTTPTTFIADPNDKSWKLIKSLGNYKELHMHPKQWVKNLWLVKPEDLNRGRGIQIFDRPREIINFISSSDPKNKFVVQKYIERPLLYNKRKFDIRIWAIFSGDDKVYFYKRGYLRTSSDIFTHDIDDNKAVHLTNNWFQKNMEDYGKFEDGNTLSFEDFQEYLNIYYAKRKFNVYDHFIKSIKDIVIDVYLASKDKLNPNNRQNWFELFGFDFMIDEDFRTWLIEVNTNPYIGIANDFIADLMPRMISEMFEITLDTVYAPKQKPVLAERNFELIYSSEKNTRRPFNPELWGISRSRINTPYSCRGQSFKISRVKNGIKRNNSKADKNDMDKLNNSATLSMSLKTKNESLRTGLLAKPFNASAYTNSKIWGKGNALKAINPPKTPDKTNKLKSDYKDSVGQRMVSRGSVPSHAISKPILQRTGSLQMSLYSLTDDLTRANSSGNYKIKDFNDVMKRIFQKINYVILLSAKDEPIDMQTTVTHAVEPAWECMIAIAKSKYLKKIADSDNGRYLKRFSRCLQIIIKSTGIVPDLKIKILGWIIEVFNYLSSGESIRLHLMCKEVLDTITQVFKWAVHKKLNEDVDWVVKLNQDVVVDKQGGIGQTWDLIIYLLWTLCTISDQKWYIPHISKSLTQMRKIAMNHHLPLYLIALVNSPLSDNTTKEFINTKVIGNLKQFELKSLKSGIPSAFSDWEEYFDIGKISSFIDSKISYFESDNLRRIEAEKEKRQLVKDFSYNKEKRTNEEDKRFQIHNKAKLPLFNQKDKDSKHAYINNDTSQSSAERLGLYKEYKNRSQQIQQEYQKSIRDKQRKAEIALKQWKRIKLQKFKRNFTRDERRMIHV